MLAGWVVLLVAAVLADHAANSTYSDTLTIPGSSAQEGLNLLRAHDPKTGGQNGQVVFVVDNGSVTDHSAAIGQARTNLAKLPHVLSVSDPLSPSTVSANGDIAYASINFNTNPQNLGESYIDSVNHAVRPARDAGVRVQYGGTLGQAAEPKANDGRSEAIGVGVALIVLLIGFGSVIAAVLPLGSAILAMITGISLLGTLAAAIAFGTSAPVLATMMGLGVGIDYALFLTTRFRQRMINGNDVDTAIRATVGHSGRSVLIAAFTVVVAMLGLYASGIAFIGKLGLAAAITVSVAALAALTLVPALLGFAGHRIDRFSVHKPVAEPSTASPGAMHRYVGLISRHPWHFTLGGIGLLLVLAIPVLSMNLGHVQPSAEPKSYSDHQAYESLQRGFGPGANGPLTIVAHMAPHTSSQQAAQTATQLEQAIAKVKNVKEVAPLTPSSDGVVLVGRVLPKTGPGTAETQTLINTLQDTTMPQVLGKSGGTGYVTGTEATTLDFTHTVSSRLPIIVGVVLLAAFLLLLISFRSPVLAFKAAVLNLFSIGAAWGVLVAVFQWGWGVKLLGLSGKVPIESYVPMIIFAIVFGLSMDYEVFLISRIREHWEKSHDNHASVAAGLSQTARVITCAALIMASVFFAFLLSNNVVVKMLALGLGVSVLVDASIIRLMIVPSLMFLFDKANWWTPAWLDRVLPHLEEKEPTADGAPTTT